MRILLVLGAALLACGCGPRAKAPDGADASGAGAAAHAAHPPRLYDAISKTAMSFTGNIEITDVDPVGPNAPPALKIIADLGHIYETDLIANQRASDKVGITPWASMMPLPEDADVAVESVTSELVNAKAPNGGFCAPDKTTTLAIATYKEEDSPDKMVIGAFSDPVWPPQGRAPHLCGTFAYEVHASASSPGAAPPPAPATPAPATPAPAAPAGAASAAAARGPATGTH
jgi:hypothetical protein